MRDQRFFDARIFFYSIISHRAKTYYTMRLKFSNERDLGDSIYYCLNAHQLNVKLYIVFCSLYSHRVGVRLL